jgi:perosamine synthetase
VIPRFEPRLGLAELSAITRLPQRNGVAEFEVAFAQAMGQRHAVAFPYGRTALLVVLKAMGVRDRVVICPAYTCVVVPHAIVASGNEPLFVDCRPGDYNMDLDEVRNSVDERTGAIIATSIFGYPIDLDQLRRLRAEFPHVPVIQDCAHSFAAEWNGEPVNGAGEAAIYGLNISKLITAIFGGMATTDSDELAARLRAIRERELRPPTIAREVRRLAYLLAAYAAFSPRFYGMVNRLERAGALNRFVRYYDEETVDMPADHLDRMTSTEGWVGRAQVARYEEVVRERQAVAEFYDHALRDLDGLHLPPLMDGATYSHYVPRTARRERVISAALGRGVQLGRLIEYCIPDMPAYRDRQRGGRDFPVAREFAHTTLNLPVSSGPAAARRVVDVLREVLP